MSFIEGDRVIVNNGIVATINVYDEENNRLVYTHEVGGGTNVVYDHITGNKLEYLTGTPTFTPAPLHEVRDGVTNTGPFEQQLTLPFGEDEDSE